MPPHTACPFFPCTPFVGRVLALVLTGWVLTSPLRASLRGIDPVYPGATRFEQANQSAFAALKADGSVVTWGNVNEGGDTGSLTNGELSSGGSGG
jgi:hypothetical protein